jgi:kynurenine formamidase
VTRGVLIDARGLRGSDMTAGEAITSAELAAALEAQRVEVRPGDIAFVRTGWAPIYHSDPQRYAASASPGLGLDAAAWLVDKRVAAIGTDTMALEVLPAEQPDTESPVHQYLLAKSGVYIVENVHLEELARTKTYEFLCLCLALPLTGATASPLRLAAVI